MVHKLFEVVGERILIIDRKWGRNKEGIFQENEDYVTHAEGNPRPALDFIEPVYNPNSWIEDLARGRKPRQRIHPGNPILSLHCGLDQLKLEYRGKREGHHTFEGELIYLFGVYFNDGNFEVYDMYKDPLKRVGFEVH